jgi:hypothetical protein
MNIVLQKRLLSQGGRRGEFQEKDTRRKGQGPETRERVERRTHAGALGNWNGVFTLRSSVTTLQGRRTMISGVSLEHLDRLGTSRVFHWRYFAKKKKYIYLEIRKSSDFGVL